MFGRLVVVLIDALRADFVLPVESNLNLPRMRFVEKLIVQRETISFRAKANPPTVTLPKIKVKMPVCFITAVQVLPALSECGKSEFPVNSKPYGNHMSISHMLICMLNSKFT